MREKIREESQMCPEASNSCKRSEKSLSSWGRSWHSKFSKSKTRSSSCSLNTRKRSRRWRSSNSSSEKRMKNDFNRSLKSNAKSSSQRRSKRMRKTRSRLSWTNWNCLRMRRGSLSTESQECGRSSDARDLSCRRKKRKKKRRKNQRKGIRKKVF